MKALRLALVLLLVLSLVLAPALAQAAKKKKEGPSPAREIWDTIWRFINFGLLAFFLVKYARRPLADFLKRHQADMGERLGQGQNVLAEAEAELKETQDRLTELEGKIAEIEGFIREEAARARQRILEEAEQNAALILADARERANSELEAARARVKAELVEMAVTEAERLIRAHLGPEDDARIIGDYLGRLAAEAQAS